MMKETTMALTQKKNLNKLLLLSSLFVYFFIDLWKIERSGDNEAVVIQERHQLQGQPKVNEPQQPQKQIDPQQHLPGEASAIGEGAVDPEQQPQPREPQQLNNPQHVSTISASTIDPTINKRLAWENEDKCDKVFLYMPHSFAGHGHGFQITLYLMAALMASYMDMAFVILEPLHELNRFDQWSQFGCPADAFEGKSHKNLKKGFPEGLSRLIQHPKWISRGCGVPTCGGTHWYHQWAKLQKQQKKQRWARGKGKLYLPPLSADCNENGRNIKVFPLDGGDVRSFWDRLISNKVIDHNSQDSQRRAYDWAIRLGATPQEAEYFTTIKDEVEISNFIGALVNRSGLLAFQPWIARDVAEYIAKADLSLGDLYDAIHVRRGDKLMTESWERVANYYKKKGHTEGDLPTNYVPFQHYLEMGWDRNACPVNKNTGQRFKVNNPRRIIYVATDDPTTVQKEIAALPKSHFGHTILNECQKAMFVFSPASKTTKSFHMTPCRNYMGTCPEDNCSKRYERTIAAIADLIILTRADKFVGEWSSTWGRLVKGFRTVFDPNSDGSLDRPPVVIGKIVEVFDYSKPTFFSY